jgi:hypothetical protein
MRILKYREFLNESGSFGLSSSGVKPGVQELFDSNPELANQVYEVLGVKSANINFNIEPFGKSIDNIHVIKDGKKIGYVQISKNNTSKILTVTGIELKERGIGKNVYLKLQQQYPGFIIKSDKTALTSDAINMWDSLVSKKLATKEGDKEYTLNTKQALQLYSQYLDTIFPDSKVKDIVYHGTTKGEFEKFITKGSNDNVGRLGAMAGSLQAANMQRGKQEKPEWVRPEEWVEPNLPQGSHLFNLKFNITNPYIAKSLDEAMSLDRNALEKQGYDSVIIEGFEEINGRLKETGFGTEYVVFEPEQIHILGSKQDIEGFKEFIQGDL